MTARPEHEDFLTDIVTACEKALEFVRGMSLDEFLADDKTQFAVVRALEVVGEASKRIPEEVRRRHRDIPWKEMGGMRDKLIHDYFGLDLHVVWKTVTEDVRDLLPRIRRVCESESGRS